MEKLGLSFNNVRRLHQIVDAQPDKAGKWTTSHLKFHNDPSTTFTVRHCNVLKAIKSVFKNPELAAALELHDGSLSTGVHVRLRKCTTLSGQREVEVLWLKSYTV